MSQVAGSLKLDLAQFRELEAFSQFASDLDKATRDSINRGRHLMEILKQPQYQPVPVEKQIIIIWASTNGYVDDVPLNLVSEWEAGLYRYLDANYQDLQNEIIENSVKGRNKMSGDLLKKLGAAVEDYKKTAAPRQDQ
jgi:F-type H+-transporting ATPase subunit alpha